MREYTLTILNMLVCICLIKQRSEYAEILNLTRYKA